MNSLESQKMADYYEWNKKNTDNQKPFIYPGRSNTNIINNVGKNKNKYAKKTNIFNRYNKFYGSLKNYSNFKKSRDNISKKFYKINQFLRLVISSIFLVLFIVAMVVFSGVFGIEKNNKKFLEYDQFIWPVVMQDPEPFNEKNPPTDEIMLNASVWRAAANQRPDCINSSNDGRIILSLENVKKSCNALFGKDFSCFNENNNLCMNFYEFNCDEKVFYVDAISNDRCFIPETVSLDNNNGSLILKVGYVDFDHQYKQHKEPKKTFKKYMEYVLKENSQTGQFYICEIRPENKS